MKDNINGASQKTISRYLQHLDNRLSVPKFKSNVSENSNSPEKPCSKLQNALSPSRNANQTPLFQKMKTCNSVERINVNNQARILLNQLSGDLFKSQEDRNFDNRERRASLMRKVQPSEMRNMFNNLRRGRNRLGVS